MTLTIFIRFEYEIIHICSHMNCVKPKIRCVQMWCVLRLSRFRIRHSQSWLVSQQLSYLCLYYVLCVCSLSFSLSSSFVQSPVVLWIMSLADQFFFVLCFILHAGATEVLSDVDSCVAPRILFTGKNVDFERCAMQHAISDNFCSNCIVPYVEQYQAYDQLLTTQYITSRNENKSCGDLLNEEDRLNILRTQYTRSRDLWRSGRCSSISADNNHWLYRRKWHFFLFLDCFACDPEFVPFNGNVSELCVLSKTAMRLMDFAAITRNCFADTKGDVCIDCAIPHSALITRYGSALRESDRGICFDVKDAVYILLKSSVQFNWNRWILQVDQVQQKWQQLYACEPEPEPQHWSWSITLFAVFFVFCTICSFACSGGSNRRYTSIQESMW